MESLLFKVFLIAAIISLGIKGYFHSLYLDNRELNPSIRGFVKYFFLGISSVVTFTSALPFFFDNRSQSKSTSKLKILKYLKFFLALFWVFITFSIVFLIIWKSSFHGIP